MIPQLQDLKLVTQADVYCNDSLAGSITRQADGGVAFRYDKHYLAEGCAPIATSLATTRDPYVGPGVRCLRSSQGYCQKAIDSMFSKMQLKPVSLTN